MDLNDMNKNCGQVVELLKVLAHPQRLMILCHLAKSERTVSELYELCNLSQSYTSQFLSRMKREGLVSSAKEGNFTTYKLDDPKVIKVIDSLYEIFSV